MKTKLETITKNIEANKEIMKGINKLNYYSVEQFINDAQRYIKAIKEEKVICSIDSVSSSGMSRTIKFLAPEKRKDNKRYMYLNFFCLFSSLGFSPAGKYGDYFRISGCGMDMIFHTNYTIIHRLGRLGMLNKKQVEKLCQETPSVI